MQSPTAPLRVFESPSFPWKVTVTYPPSGRSKVKVSSLPLIEIPEGAILRRKAPFSSLSRHMEVTSSVPRE
ncbi:hypothetical protein [Thermococcus sp. P6]|uniref:hypothetical protein n=1 Tax=Thermococcus sp. P6 TaxID=122420 RepID=UPI0012FE347A|nr:hypothetical protein [Thermococcus sp. P6]